MKILFLSNIPAPYRVTFFNEISKKHELLVLFDKNNNENRNKEWFKPNKYNFNYCWLKKFSLFQLILIIKKGKFDIVISGNYASLSGMILALYTKLKKTSYVLTADGGFIDDSSIIKSKLKKIFISMPTYWISTGKETNKYLIHYGAKENKIFTFPFSSLLKKDILDIPTPSLIKNRLKKAYNIKSKKVFITIGSFINRKGFDILLETINKNKFSNILFIIVGGGELKENYKKYLKENRISNVILLDFLNKEKLYDYYHLSDCFVFPTREDIWGLVINEAMACGLPIISSDKCLASLELLNKKYIYPVNNRKKLAKLIQNFGNMNTKDLIKIGQDNINKINNYTIEAMVKKHLEIFEIIIQNEKKREKNEKK